MSNAVSSSINNHLDMGLNMGLDSGLDMGLGNGLDMGHGSGMNTGTSTADRLRAILVKDYKLNPEQLTPEARLVDLGLDSLCIAELMFNIEDEFGVEMTSDPTQIATFADVVQFIDELLAARSSSCLPSYRSASSAVPEDNSYASAQSSVSTVNGVPLAT